MQSARPVFSLLARNVRYSHGKPSSYVLPSMNEMPVPCGCWQEVYNAKQRKYNTILAAGIGFFAFSLTVAKQSGIFFLNYYAPEHYE